MSEMAQTADHLLVVARGRIIADAPIDELVGRRSGGAVRVRAVDPARLAAALFRQGAQVEAAADGSMVVTGLDAAAVSAVAAAESVNLVELGAQTTSLEEAFFDLTADQTDYRATELAGVAERV
jgi:ABC-2 type transport system ATP-binding protein